MPSRSLMSTLEKKTFLRLNMKTKKELVLRFLYAIIHLANIKPS